MRKEILLVGFVLAMFCLFMSCQMEAEVDLAEVEKSIEEMNTKLSEAVAKGDAEAAAACYTEDAQAFPPNEKMISGRDDIKEFFAAGFAKGFSGLELTVSEVSGAGDMAYETGTYETTVNPGGQDVVAFTDKGKYIVIWKKGEDGTWRLHRDVWNSNMTPSMEISAKE